VLGDALIAAAATGHVGDLAATAEAWQETGAPVHPDRRRHHTYARFQAAHRELALALPPVFDRLAEASSGADGAGPEED
jgi:xylulokinase